MSKWNNGYSVGDLRSKLYENVKNENGGFLNNNVRYARNIEDTTKLQKEIERLNNIINVIKEELSKDFCNYICKNRTYGKTFKAGAEVYKEYLLYKIKELENSRSDE